MNDNKSKKWQKYIGETYNSLTFIKMIKLNNKYVGLFSCVCGKETTGDLYAVINGKKKSCGCLRKSYISSSKTRHGHSTSKYMSTEYNSWRAMNERCYNKNNIQYKDYGGRGIRVYSRWRKFDYFLKDMGTKPTPKHSIERLNTNGDYRPKNCIWADRITQSNNKRNSVSIELNGVRYSLKEWSEILNINYSTIKSRYSRGIPINRYH